jgi:hypothetical protein
MFRKKNKCSQDLDYLTANDLQDNKVNYDKLVRLTPYLEKDKALTYSIILNQRDDLDEETKAKLKIIIDENGKREKQRLERYLETMEPKVY